MLKLTEIDETEPVTPLIGITPGESLAKQVSERQGESLPAPVLTDSKDLIRKLSSRNALVRAEAERHIKSMDVPTLLALMTEQKRLRNQRLIGVGVAILISFILMPVLAFLLHTPMIFFFWQTTTVGLAVAGAAFTQIQKSVALALAPKEDLNSVGELVAALAMRDKEVQQAIRPVLTRLLRQLRAQDAPLLNVEARRVLHLFMEGTLIEKRFGRQRPTEEEILLLLAVLKALEQVGDSSFLPVVKAWANGQQRGSDLRIHQAAKECLPYLEQCSTNREASQEMLRASAPDPALDARDLLRPASGADGASAENLLRPADPDPPEIS